MKTDEQIQNFISTLPESKQDEVKELHNMMQQIGPDEKLWYFDGTNEEGKVVANPTIGYGTQNLVYAKGNTREFFKLGISPNTTGISLHIIGISDKNFLKERFGPTLGKASITGYCIKFKTLKELDKTTLHQVLQYGIDRKI